MSGHSKQQRVAKQPNLITPHRLPGEPHRWHERFCTYVNLGVKRSVEATYRAHAPQEKLRSKRPGAQWFSAMRRWNWEDRAAAVDAERRAALQQREEERRFDKREVRLSIIESLLTDSVKAFETLNLQEADVDFVREAFPTLRLLLRDLLQADRLEMGEPTTVERVEGGGLNLSADDVAGVLGELKRYQGAGGDVGLRDWHGQRGAAVSEVP